MSKKNFFEGWYFKIQTEEITLAFIPEISYDPEGNSTGSLQVVMEENGYFFAYEHPTKMKMKKGVYFVLEKNVFTDVCIHLDIDEPKIKIKGDVYLDQRGPSFDVMGILRFFPMPCSHGILAMEQKLSGNLAINDREYDFEGGKGYLETDFGHSFPKSYLWSQCNWFEDADCQISMAVVALPIGRHTIMGTYVCISSEGKKYKLATYKGAEVMGFSSSGFTITQGPYTFEGQREGGQPVELKSPIAGKMSGKTKEYLKCTVTYTLKKRGDEIFSLKSDMASFEYF